MNSKTDRSRRAFLQMIGAAVPTVMVAVNDPIARLNAVGDASADTSSTKCTPLDLKRYFTASSKDFGPRARARELGRGSEHDGYIRTPGVRRCSVEYRFCWGQRGQVEHRDPASGPSPSAGKDVVRSRSRYRALTRAGVTH